MLTEHMQKLIAYPKDYLVASQIAPVVGKDPQTIRYLARNMPERLPFPCISTPTQRTVTFPKIPFLRAYGYEPAKEAP